MTDEAKKIYPFNLDHLTPRKAKIELEPLPTQLIKSTAEFLERFEPPEYLWDGILRRRFLYSLTAQTGAGKTAFALLISAYAARGALLCGREIEGGCVLYFAGENPDDIRMRWIVMRALGIAPEDGVFFVDGSHEIAAIVERVAAELTERGLELALVVVDTSAAYFRGEMRTTTRRPAGTPATCGNWPGWRAGLLSWCAAIRPRRRPARP
jgi:AAA domain